VSAGQHGLLVGMVGGEVATSPLASLPQHRKPLDTSLLRLADMLAN
jgi:hypothetical protein